MGSISLPVFTNIHKEGFTLNELNCIVTERENGSISGEDVITKLFKYLGSLQSDSSS
jgi:hypothetical protein